MAVASGTCRANPNTQSKRRLWSDSGGYCGNPQCRQYLFPDDLDIDFGELAHVIAATPGGPRDLPTDELALPDRAHHSNLILLCANCHTMIDKAAESFPAEMLRDWKEKRFQEIATVLSAPVFTTRSEARAHVQSLLDENALIHTKYGPGGDPYHDGNPEMWRRYARATMVPNNRMILRTLEANSHLLTIPEKAALSLYRLHAQQFENRHVLSDFTTGTERFPVAITDVFREGSEGQP